MLPLPVVYVAVLLSAPITRGSCGVPVTGTFSSKVIVTDKTSVAFRKLFRIPVALVIATLLTVGGVVSPVTAKLGVGLLVLPARSVSLTLN